MSYAQNLDKNYKNVRLAAEITVDSAPEVVERLALTNRIVINSKHPKKPYHALEGFNQGKIEDAPEYTFSLYLPSTSKHVRLLTNILENDLDFTMRVYNLSGDNQGWQLLEQRYYGCSLIEEGEEVVVGDITLVRYNGIALRRDPQVMLDNVATFISEFTQVNAAAYGTGNADIATQNATNALSEWAPTTTT